MTMDREAETGMKALVSRISELTKALLEDGAEVEAVAFALTSVAADMGLQLTREPLKLFPVLLSAIAIQASNRVDKENSQEDVEKEDVGISARATLH